MDNILFQKNQRLSRVEKEANDKQWYKDKINLLDTNSNRTTYGLGGISEYHRMKVNYDLFNNIVDLRDFEYVCKPFGAETGELPAKMVNRDILSNKIKVVLGMEMKRPLDYKVLAVNPEATTRKEQESLGRIKDFVINQITAPIKKKLELEAQQQAEGKELTHEQIKQLEAQVQEQLKTLTPEEVKVYMEREHQDPAEVLGNQLLQYLIQKRNVKDKFSNGTKHAAITAKEFYWVGEVNGEPDVRVCDSLRCHYDVSPDLEFVEDGEWFTYEYRMTPSECISFFSDELDEKEIDAIYKDYANYTNNIFEKDLFDFSRQQNLSRQQYANTVRVLHATWKSLREVLFLTYTDEEGNEQTKIVDEYYKLNKEAGDLYIESRWLKEAYEGYKIGSSIFKKMRPIIGQYRNIDDLYTCKLPYYGAIYDSTNSQPTSLLDRGKVWQYYLNIAYYRAELVMAADKGKKVFMNVNAVPDSAGIDIEKFQYFLESSPFGWFNPNEEGVGYADVNTIVKVIDLSTTSDLAKYIELVNVIKEECGEAMGVSRQMEAQINTNDAVTNTRQALVQNSYILEPFFNLHNRIKKNVLTALLECAKVCYRKKKPQKLNYILDDMSVQTLYLDPVMLSDNDLGLFISDSSKAQEIKDTITGLAHAALQNQQARLSEVLSIIKEDSITVAEEKLKVSEREAEENAYRNKQQELEHNKQLEEMKIAHEREKWKHEENIVILKEEEKRKTEVVKGSLVGASFNPNQDADNDGENDFIELAKHGLDAEIKRSKNQLDREKFEYQKQADKDKMVLEEKKLKAAQVKNTVGK